MRFCNPSTSPRSCGARSPPNSASLFERRVRGRYTKTKSAAQQNEAPRQRVGYTDRVTPLPDQPPFPVLAHFAPHARGLTWHRVSGGFSGAHVWRGDENLTPRLALKAWPPNTTPERLRQIHAWMLAVRQLPFVPEVLPGAGGRTAFLESDRVWDCCRWLPGEPRPTPTPEDVAAACEAVAALHVAWATFAAPRGPCPGVRNRLRVLAENESLLRAGPDALPSVSPELDPLLRRAVGLAGRLAPLAIAALRPWEHRACALQPCVRDLRGEHVLFSAHAVTGIIDFGAAAVDHPAVDLARLLTDLTGSDPSLFTAGLNAYRTARSAFDATDDFVELLAETGTVCSVLGWLVRLVARREPLSDAGAIAVRLALLVGRAESLALR
jgi:Ser/Thr protein kinase RdoA (MazF antagonist)